MIFKGMPDVCGPPQKEVLVPERPCPAVLRAPLPRPHEC